MDRSYLLNEYISDEDQNNLEKNEAIDNLDKLQVRLRGTKTLDEIKHEVFIFLDKNNVPFEVSNGLTKICDSFDDKTDYYHARTYIEDFMNKYYALKEKTANESDDKVREVKNDVVENAKKDLENIGVSLIGDNDIITDNIKDRDDAYRLMDNVSVVTDYYREKNQLLNEENIKPIDLQVEDVNQVIERPNDETLLSTVLEQEDKKVSDGSIINQVDIKEDGSIVVNGDATNMQSMSFVAAMTSSLIVSKIDFNINLDMKLIKDPNETSKFKVIYGDFPLNNKAVNSATKEIATDLINNYNPNISYFDILTKKAPELVTSLMIVNEDILNKKGAFQMAVKTTGFRHDILFAMDENYTDTATAFRESGALISQDVIGNCVVKVDGNSLGDQVTTLNATLENIRQRNNNLVNSNNNQKKLIYKNDQAANVNNIFLITITIAEVILSLFGIYFITH